MTWRGGIVAGILGAAVMATIARADDGNWAFLPKPDTFDSNALVDLRSLNEPTAGKSGYVKLSSDGNDFVLGNGQPARFWGVTEGIQAVPNITPEIMLHKAKWLAKRGVNVVRVHTALQPGNEGSRVTDVNQAAIDQVWRLVAAMKQAGIYTTISPYWGTATEVKASWGVPGGKQNAGALLFFDPTLQKGYKAWLKALFSPSNPYTHTPLAKDPAVAIFQIQNEDSMLFWTIQSVKGPALQELQSFYGEWLKKKYGSMEKALAAWDNVAADGDNAAQGRAGIFLAWEWTQPQTGGKAKRLADQLEFITETMKNFNQMIVKYMRDDLGCKALINAGNWKTVDDVALNDAERYSYTATEVMGVNRYYGGIHQGPRGGWGIDPGDKFTNASVLLDPRGFPLNLKYVVGHPFIISESQWVPPDAWQAEGPFLVAAYGSLVGHVAFYWFAEGDTAEWQVPFAGWGGNPMNKWQVGTPEQLGQFPAAALMLRKQYIERGKSVVHEERSLSDLWERRSPVVSEASGFDPNRDRGDAIKRSNLKTPVDPLAYFVGPVEVKYGGDPAKTTAEDLSKYIDTSNKTVKSETGQLMLNYGIGVCTLNAPKAQGACGFLSKAGAQKLDDVTIDSSNEYASVLVVSVDGQPISTSKKVLLQVGTVARPHGWQDQDATFASGNDQVQGKEVVNNGDKVGSTPWVVTNAAGTVTVSNAGLSKATLLDANLLPTDAVPVTKDGDKLVVKLPPNAMYIVLR